VATAPRVARGVVSNGCDREGADQRDARLCIDRHSHFMPSQKSRIERTGAGEEMFPGLARFALA
jgi:hypothetical protein